MNECWLSILCKVLIHRNIAIYSRRRCFLPCWLFVSFGIWRNVWDCVQDSNKSSQKACQERKRPCYVYWPACHLLAKPSCLGKSKCMRMSYWRSRVYIANPCYEISSKHTVYFARDKIKGVDAVGSIGSWN